MPKIPVCFRGGGPSRHPNLNTYDPVRRRPSGTAPGRRDAPAAVSRILCSPRTEAAIICLCDQNPGLIAPRAAASSPIWSCCGRGLPCGAALADAPGGLLPRLFTLASDGSEAVSFLWHWPSRGIWSAVSFFSKGLPALCSPDFPQRPGANSDRRDCPQPTHLYRTVNIAIPLKYTRGIDVFLPTFSASSWETAEKTVTFRFDSAIRD